MVRQKTARRFSRFYLTSAGTVCRSIHCSSARDGTRTARPLRRVGNCPDAIIRYTVARPSDSRRATSSAFKSSLSPESVAFCLVLFILQQYTIRVPIKTGITRDMNFPKTI